MVENAHAHDPSRTETCLQQFELTLRLPASNENYHSCYKSIRLASPISDHLRMQQTQRSKDIGLFGESIYGACHESTRSLFSITRLSRSKTANIRYYRFAYQSAEDIDLCYEAILWFQDWDFGPFLIEYRESCRDHCFPLVNTAIVNIMVKSLL